MLKDIDPEIFELINSETKRQEDVLELIPSENYVSRAVLEALGSSLTNKYSEGYPGKRYYQGNKFIDEIETIAVTRAKKLFGVPYVNVQPYSGSPANLAAYSALMKPGEVLLGMNLSSGGHLTHGAPVTFSGTNYKSVQYGVGKDGFIEYREVESLAIEHKPKIIICGTTAYPRILDFQKFSKIAEKVGAYLLADISHISGLIIGDVHPTPVPYAHIVMTTTHKTLRGPRGAILMVTDKGLQKDPELAEKIEKAVFPGLQGGPHENVIAAVAVALKEADSQEFKEYAEQIVKNAKVLAEELIKKGLTLVSGGTDNHLMLIDLQNIKVNGRVAAEALEAGGIVVNRNAVPFDPMPPFYPSGIRLGTPAVTTRGMKEIEMKQIALWIYHCIDHVKKLKLPEDKTKRADFIKMIKHDFEMDGYLKDIEKEVKDFCNKFPINF